jgi:hypothetical protein
MRLAMDSSNSPDKRKVGLDDRNTHSFRVPHRTKSATRTPQKADVGPTQHQLAVRFKSLITDCVGYLSTHPHDDTVADHFIAIADDAVKCFKQARVENRQSRRARATTDNTSAEVVESAELSPSKAPTKAKPVHVDPSTARPARESAWTKPPVLTREMSRPENTSEDRVRDAARAAERVADAEARRKLMAAERQQKLEAKADHAADVKARREAAEQRIRDESTARGVRSTSQRQRELDRKREFASKDAAKVDEAVFIVAAEAENRALDIDERLRNTARNSEQIAQQKQVQAKERAEAREHVVSRAKSADRQKYEAQVQRVQSKEEQRQRHEADRRRETEEKSTKSEERRGRVQEQQHRVQTETEARHSRAAERVENSEKIREELANKQREKLERQEAKLKEVRERRERDVGRTKLYDVMLARSTASQEAAEENLKRCAALVSRHAKTFLDEIQMPAASQKSKLRSIMARFAASSGNSAQYRQPLHDLNTALEGCAPADFGALRCASGLPLLVDAFGRGKVDNSTARLLADVLQKVVLNSAERAKNIEFFVRAGCIGRILDVVADELKNTGRHATTSNLTTALVLLYAASDYVIYECRGKPEFQSYRHMLFDAIEALDIFNYSLSLAMIAMQEDMLTLQAGLALVRCFFATSPPKKANSSKVVEELHDRMCHALITCIANMLMPGGQQLKSDTSISPASSGVLFLALRLLNDISRRDLRAMHTMVADSATSMIFSHVVTSVSGFVNARETELEPVPPTTLPQGEQGPSKSFTDALKAGITFNRFPLIDYSAKKQPTFVRAAFHELLLLVGYVAINNVAVQDVFAYGREAPLLCNVIAALPVSYFGVSKHIAFPSLIAVCFRHRRNLQILMAEMDAEALLRFLDDEIQAFGIAKETSEAPAVNVASWADMMDDDDDLDAMFASRAPPPSNSADIEEQVAEAVKTKDAAPYACFFRFDKRLASGLWAQARADLAAAIRESVSNE